MSVYMKIFTKKYMKTAKLFCYYACFDPNITTTIYIYIYIYIYIVGLFGGRSHICTSHLKIASKY